MSLLAQGSDKEVIPNTFASQYISIILIIFTCIVWVFFSDTKKISKHAASQAASASLEAAAAVGQKKPAVPLAEDLSSLALKDLFSVSGDSLNEDSVEALTAFLSSHDVDAEFEIMLSDESFERGFSMSRILDDYFHEKALPVGSVKVFVRAAQKEEGVQVHFKKSRLKVLSEASS